MACLRHGANRWHDRRFAATRCAGLAGCGHRIANDDGSPVRSTRSFPPTWWVRELRGRARARRQFYPRGGDL